MMQNIEVDFIPSKSRILILQSLGRGLRISEGKEKLNLFDISEVLQDSKARGLSEEEFVKSKVLDFEKKLKSKVFYS